MPCAIAQLTSRCWMCTEALREAQSQNKDLGRQVQELMTIRVQLQNERDGLQTELSDTKDALKDATARLDAANAALVQLRTDMEHRLREKDDEIDNIRFGFFIRCFTTNVALFLDTVLCFYRGIVVLRQ